MRPGRARALQGWPRGLTEKVTSEKGLEGESVSRLQEGRVLVQQAAGAGLAGGAQASMTAGMSRDEEDVQSQREGGSRSPWRALGTL